MTINHSMLNQGLVKLVTPDVAVPAWKPLEVTPDGISGAILDLLFLTTYCPAAAWVGLWYAAFDVPYTGAQEWRWEWPAEFYGNYASNQLFVAATDPLPDPRQPCRCTTLTNQLEVYGFYSRVPLMARGITMGGLPAEAIPWIAFQSPGGTCRLDQHTLVVVNAVGAIRIPCFIPETEYTAAMLANDNLTTGTWAGTPVTLEIAGIYKVIEEIP